MRRTYTSPEVKDRWNREHYDRIGIYVPIGSRTEIQHAAAARGMSVGEYIRHLIIADTDPAESPILRGGGGPIVP